MLILGQKVSKIALFEKMRILGRRSFESGFITKKFQDQKIDVKFFILGQKMSKNSYFPIKIFQNMRYKLYFEHFYNGSSVEEELPDTWDENT